MAGILKEADLEKIGKLFTKGVGKQIRIVKVNVTRVNNACQIELIRQRERYFADALSSRFRNTANLIAAPVKTPPAGTTTPSVKALADHLAKAVTDCKIHVEHISKKGVYRLILATFSPEDSRKFCAEVLATSKTTFQDVYGLAVFYDNPPVLRDARARARRFLTAFVEAKKLVSPTDKVERVENQLLVNGAHLCDAIWIPENEEFWPVAYELFDKKLKSIRGSPPSVPGGLLKPEMCSLFARSEGLSLVDDVEDEEMEES